MASTCSGRYRVATLWHDSSMSTARPVVLVHGAWHGAWCFAELQAALDRRGVPSYAIDLPGHGSSPSALGDLHADGQHVADTLARLPGPTVLVGHSYGGAVITEAASRHAAIEHLVYLTAFALDRDESINGLLRSLPRAAVALSAAIRPHDDGTTTLDPTLARAALYGQCEGPAVDAAIARLSPQSMVTFAQSVTGSPRDRVPSTYVRCLRDEAVHISHQDVMAARCNDVVTLDTDHAPYLSRVDDTADVLERIARS